jgi:hypothetical protein
VCGNKSSSDWNRHASLRKLQGRLIPVSLVVCSDFLVGVALEVFKGADAADKKGWFFWEGEAEEGRVTIVAVRGRTDSCVIHASFLGGRFCLWGTLVLRERVLLVDLEYFAVAH